MKTSLAEAFCLADNRRNFQINVRASTEDRAAYFGTRRLNDELIRDIEQQYSMGMPPKKYLRGLYGVGKTHTLFNLKYHLSESPEAVENGITVRCPHIEGEFSKKTDFSYLYGQMMGAIGLTEISSLIQLYLQQNASPTLTQDLERIFGDADVARAIHTLGLGGQDVTLWKWLRGGSLTAAELTGLRMTKNLTSAGDLTNTLIAICRLFQEQDINYLFLLDELEGVRNVQDADAQRSFHDAFRRLADDGNDSVGFIVSVYATKDEDIPEFIFEADIRGRLGGKNIHELEYFQQSEDVEKFLDDLFTLVVDPEKKTAAEGAGEIPSGLSSYPFTADALEQFVDRATSSVTASIPRNIIKAVNECAVQALNRDTRVIDIEDLGPAAAIFVEIEY